MVENAAQHGERSDLASLGRYAALKAKIGYNSRRARSKNAGLVNILLGRVKC